MERLKSRAWIAAGIFLVSGLFVQFGPKAVGSPKTEKWMESQAPKSVGKFAFVPSSENPEQSYQMSESTYEVLKPYGIVARVFRSGNQHIDAVLIASASEDSFHDPRHCFSGSGYNIVSQEERSIDTGRGKIPITVARLAGDGNTFAVFFYKGPGGFYATTNSLKFAMFKDALLRARYSDAVFYRFMPASGNVSEDDLYRFIAEYMKASQVSSGGYF
jgi:hypothetical protein